MLTIFFENVFEKELFEDEYPNLSDQKYNQYLSQDQMNCKEARNLFQ